MPLKTGQLTNMEIYQIFPHERYLSCILMKYYSIYPELLRNQFYSEALKINMILNH